MTPEARIIPADAAGILLTAGEIRRGLVVGFPTETLYGLGALALDGDALQLLSAIKGRPTRQPFPVLISAMEELELLAARVPIRARRLMDLHWPGPLTIILPGRASLPAEVLGPGGGVGVRISSDPVALALVRQVAAPVTCTSANLSGESPAVEAQGALIEGVTLVLDGGRRDAPPSTVVDATGEELRVLRQGTVTL